MGPYSVQPPEVALDHGPAIHHPDGHTHDDDDDLGGHIHPHEIGGAEVDNAVVLTSVGVDIGSSTSHFAVSRLRLTMQGGRYAPAGASNLYESEVQLTPYLAGELIDVASLREFIDEQYQRAGITRDDVDTGAVLLTGVAAERSNARGVGDVFAESTGKFVAVSAGHHLEAELGARGSGALALSRTSDLRVLHIDVGGGTTKLVLCDRGHVSATGAIAVGARIVVRDSDGRVERLERAGRVGFHAIGLDHALGDVVADAGIDALCEYLAEQVASVVAAGSLGDVADDLRLTEFAQIGRVDAVTFSGGVAEFIYGREERDFGDLGRRLGSEIRARVECLGVPVLEPTSSGIRATVMGASKFTVRVSSQTILVDPVEALPIRNVPAVVVDPGPDGDVAEAIRSAVATRDLDLAHDHIAIALRWHGSASYQRLGEVCAGIADAMKPYLIGDRPLIMVADQDVGRLLGMHLRDHDLYAGPMISIDGIELRTFDYLDIGAVAGTTGTTAVVVRSLIFPS